MPRLWADTMDSHRQQVRDAVLDATAGLVAERGPLSVGMSAIAERAGIGRATLYKYFPDVESVLVAWHDRHFAEQRRRLEALLEADHVTLDDVADLLLAQRRHHPPAAAADVVGPLAHTLAGAAGGAIEREVVALLTRLVVRLVDQQAVRDDEAPELLARWLLHAAHAPAALDDRAVAKLVADALAPPRRGRRR